MSWYGIKTEHCGKKTWPGKESSYPGSNRIAKEVCKKIRRRIGFRIIRSHLTGEGKRVA